jgi:hypothetical protein
LSAGRVDGGEVGFHSGRPMNYDLSELLQEWEYKPGQVIARRFTAKDGDKVQLRVDLGILQMNVDGRPDGKRPLGKESWFHVFKKRAAATVEEGGKPFHLGAEDCARLQQEAIQYHHRYICFFQLQDFEGVERDCMRNLEVFEFVDSHAESDDLAWGLTQFTSQLLMMRTRARCEAHLVGKRHGAAIAAIEEGLAAIEAFYREQEREDLLEQSGEVQSLRHRLEELRKQPPEDPLERLRLDLAEAIRREDYERAAEVRDQLRKLSPET